MSQLLAKAAREALLQRVIIYPGSEKRTTYFSLPSSPTLRSRAGAGARGQKGGTPRRAPGAVPAVEPRQMRALRGSELPGVGTVCKQEDLLARRVAQAVPLHACFAGTSAVLQPRGHGATPADGRRCRAARGTAGTSIAGVLEEGFVFRNVRTAAHAVPRPPWRSGRAAELPGGMRHPEGRGHGGDWKLAGGTGVARHLHAPGSLLELRGALRLFPRAPSSSGSSHSCSQGFHIRSPRASFSAPAELFMDGCSPPQRRAEHARLWPLPLLQL